MKTMGTKWKTTYEEKDRRGVIKMGISKREECVMELNYTDGYDRNLQELLENKLSEYKKGKYKRVKFSVGGTEMVIRPSSNKRHYHFVITMEQSNAIDKHLCDEGVERELGWNIRLVGFRNGEIKTKDKIRMCSEQWSWDSYSGMYRTRENKEVV